MTSSVKTSPNVRTMYNRHLPELVVLRGKTRLPSSLLKDGQSRIELKDQMSTKPRGNTRVQCRRCDASSKEKSAVGLRANRTRENRDSNQSRLVADLAPFL